MQQHKICMRKHITMATCDSAMPPPLASTYILHGMWLAYAGSGCKTHAGDVRHLSEISEYSKKFTSNRNPVRALNCRNLVEEYVRNDYQVALIVNLMPESADELIALIPQLSVRTLPSCCHVL